MLRNPSAQHFLGCLSAVGLSVVAPCILPGVLAASAAGAVGGLAGNLLANALQKRLRERETDPALPDINHDMLRLIGHAVSAEIAQFGRDHATSLGDQLKSIETLAKGSDEQFVALFLEAELPGIAPPDANALLTQSSRDACIPPVGKLENWQTLVHRLASRCKVVLSPEVESQLASRLHTQLWESIRKALKRDFAEDGKGYAALHLQFMGDVMARLDELAQPAKESAQSAAHTRELLEELRHHKQSDTDPKARQIIGKLSASDKTRLSSLVNRFDQLSAHLDRHFRTLLDEIRAADRASRGRDIVTHHKLKWVLGSVCAAIVLSVVTYLSMLNSQTKSDAIKQDTQAMRDDIKLIVDRLMSQVSEKDHQIGSMRTQLEDAVRRLSAAGQSGDALAKKQLDDLRAGGDARLLGAFLDDQIARQAQATIELLRERAAIAHVTGEIDRAEHCLRSIIGMQPNDLDATNRLGNIYVLRGDLPAAEKQYRRLLELTSGQTADDESWQAVAYGNLGNISKIRGDLDGAEAMLRKSLALEEKYGRLEGMADDYGNLGNLLKIRGDLDEAQAMHRKALAIDEKLGNLEGMASDYTNLGNILQARGDLDGAQAMQQKALAINEKLGWFEGMAINYGNLGAVLETRGDLDGAQAMHRKALAIDEKLGRLEGMAIAYANLGRISDLRKDFAEARRLWTLSRDLFAKLGAKPKVVQVQGWLDELAAQ